MHNDIAAHVFALIAFVSLGIPCGCLLVWALLRSLFN